MPKGKVEGKTKEDSEVGELVKINLPIDDDLYGRVVTEATVRNITPEQFILVAIRNGLNQHPEPVVA